MIAILAAVIGASFGALLASWISVLASERQARRALAEQSQQLERLSGHTRRLAQRLDLAEAENRHLKRQAAAKYMPGMGFGPGSISSLRFDFAAEHPWCQGDIGAIGGYGLRRREGS